MAPVAAGTNFVSLLSSGIADAFGTTASFDGDSSGRRGNAVEGSAGDGDAFSEIESSSMVIS